MQRLYSELPNIQDRILIRELIPPSHAGECEYGFSLVFCENKWQFEIEFYAAANRPDNIGFDYIDIPDDVWGQNPYEALRNLVLKEARLDTYITGRDSCIEWEKLEKLFENNRNLKYHITNNSMDFSHCDKEEKYFTLHDCTADRAYFENGKLGFEFNDGFWISPDHPDSHLSKVVRTDRSKVEYTLEDGEDYDVTIYVFKKTVFHRIIRTEWTVQDLVLRINNGTCKLEFLYQYFDGYSRIIECELTHGKKPHCRECVLKISAPEVSYYWNNLREDRPW